MFGDILKLSNFGESCKGLALRFLAVNFEFIKVTIIAIKDILFIPFQTGDQIAIYNVQFVIMPEC